LDIVSGAVRKERLNKQGHINMRGKNILLSLVNGVERRIQKEKLEKI